VAAPTSAAAGSARHGPVRSGSTGAPPLWTTSRIEQILKLEGPYTSGLTAAQIPVDLVTASASGLDPDISVAAAEFQAPRIAAVRNISVQQVQQLIADATAAKTLGFLGEPHVNVLALNLALDAVAPSS